MHRKHLIVAAGMAIGTAVLIGCSDVPPVPTGGQAATPAPAEPISATAHPNTYSPAVGNAAVAPTTAPAPGEGGNTANAGGYNDTGANNAAPSGAGNTGGAAANNGAGAANNGNNGTASGGANNGTGNTGTNGGSGNAAGH